MGVYMSTLGERLKLIRKENNLTQEELGKIFGLTKYSISLYENNKTSPNDDFKAKIASYFNVSVDWLLGLTDEKLPADKIKEATAIYRKSNQYSLDDFLKKIPDLTEKEKSSLEDHLEFALKLIKKERAEKNREKNSVQE